jgi:hypothetical protein
VRQVPPVAGWRAFWSFCTMFARPLHAPAALRPFVKHGVVLFGAVWLWCAEARGQPTPVQTAAPAQTEYAPAPQLTAAPDAALTQEHGWPAGTLKAQLDRDPTRLAFGKGALFVPAMVNPLDEPQVSVWRGGVLCQQATTGMRIVLDPGEYWVQVGSGEASQRPGRSMLVHELKTTIVPPFWAGLTVHVADAQLNSLRAPYEIFRMRDREYIGVGFGSDERAGEPVATWLLPAGLYRIVRIGSSYLARTDFATVRLQEGEHTQFLLVLDPDTGAFQGAGEARPEELFRPSSGSWASLMFGGDVSLTSRRRVLGYPDGSGYAFNSFLDAKANFQIQDNPLLLRLQLLEGQTKLPGQPWQKLQDRLQLDMLYIYRLRTWAGPYVRATGTVNVLVGRQYFTTPQTLSVHDNLTQITTVSQANRITLSPPFGSFNLREGAGFNLRVLKNIFGEATLRTGLGFLQVLNRGHVLQDVSDPTQSIHAYDRLGSSRQVGIEATVIASARLTRYLVLNAIVDTLIPFADPQKPNLDIEGTVAVKLTQYLSVNYLLRFMQVPEVYTNAILQQDVFLRLNLEIL